MPRRPWSDRSREGAVGSEETIMLDCNQPPVPRRDPWNKGRLIGQKRPLCGRSGSGSRWSAEPATSPCSTSRSTANSGAAISCGCRSTMSASAAGSVTARPSFRRRRAGRCSSRLPSRPLLLSASGSPPSMLARAGICSQAFSGKATLVDAAIRPHRPSMGGPRRAQYHDILNTLFARKRVPKPVTRGVAAHPRGRT